MSSKTPPASLTVPEPTFDWPTLDANKDARSPAEAAYTTTLERHKVELVKSRAVLKMPTPCGWRPAHAYAPKPS